MNDEIIVKKMIEFVEETESEIQKNRLINDPQTKYNAIKSIINRLEECVKNED